VESWQRDQGADAPRSPDPDCYPTSGWIEPGPSGEMYGHAWNESPAVLATGDGRVCRAGNGRAAGRATEKVRQLGQVHELPDRLHDAPLRGFSVGAGADGPPKGGLPVRGLG